MTHGISMNASPKSDDWIAWATQKNASGNLDEMAAEELFDHTWEASGHHILRLLKPTAAMRLLDAGCGWGRVIHSLKYHRPELAIDGIELTEEFVLRARDILTKSGMMQNVNIQQGDL